jgi:hypothetical protein
MQRNLLAAFALVAATTGAAWAESPTVLKDTFVSAKSRAEVQAELHAYKRAGVNPHSISYNPLHSFKSTASRADVVGAYLADRDQVAALHGEDSGSTYFAQARTPASDTSTTLAGRPVLAR